MDRAGDSPLSSGKKRPGSRSPPEGRGRREAVYLCSIFSFLFVYFPFSGRGSHRLRGGRTAGPVSIFLSFYPPGNGRPLERPALLFPPVCLWGQGSRGPRPPACAPVGKLISLRITAPGPPSGAFSARTLPFIPNPAPFLGGVRVGRRRTGRRGGFFHWICSCSVGKTVHPGVGQVLLFPVGEEGAFCASGLGERLLNSFSPESPFSLPPKKGFSACALLYLL